jgi:hypothetical protein
VKWVGSFISNRTTTLCLPEYNTNAFSTHSGIHQNTPLSPIFFLFYNANLVDICNPLTLPATEIGSADNVNALAFDQTIKENCRTQQTFHERSLDWARKHGVPFALDKYILVQLTKARTKHKTSCPLVLSASRLYPSPSACVLGAILDKKLS